MPSGFPELGRVLRLWRTNCTDLTQKDVGQLTSSGTRRISNWERGDRGIYNESVEKLDHIYGAGGALMDMVSSMGTPHGLPARRSWALNRQEEVANHWAWLRPHPGTVAATGRMRAEVTWCGFALEVDCPCDEDGVFVQFVGSDPGLTARVTLGEPGWVDFGQGTIPPRLGIPVHSFLAGCHPIDLESLVGLMSTAIARCYATQPDAAKTLRTAFERRLDILDAAALANADPASHHGSPQPRIIDPPDDAPTRDPLTGPPASHPFTGADYKRLRSARCYSQGETAAMARRLAPAEPVTAGKVGRVEGGGEPRISRIRALLDRVYFADGRTLLDPVVPTTRRSPCAISFPDYWVGPVWLTFARDDSTPPTGHNIVAAPADVDVSWRGVEARVSVELGEALGLRRPYGSADGLTVRYPEGWTVTAGMGFRPDAREIDFDHWAVGNQDIYHRLGIHPRLVHLFGFSE